MTSSNLHLFPLTSLSVLNFCTLAVEREKLCRHVERHDVVYDIQHELNSCLFSGYRYNKHSNTFLRFN